VGYFRSDTEEDLFFSFDNVRTQRANRKPGFVPWHLIGFPHGSAQQDSIAPMLQPRSC
jgi:hypothetical protein